MQNKSMVYISYVDIDNAVSGSKVRPKQMLKWFRAKGVEVQELVGEQTKKNRRSQVKKLLHELHEKKPDFCYIESPTYPIMRHCDRKLIKQIHDMGIPVAYFYRDFYRKFPLYFNKKGFYRKIKDLGLDFLQWRTDRVLRFCDIVYFPSEECKELFSYKDMRVLPPAGENHLPEEKRNYNYTCIYVGGIIGHYDGKLLLDSFGELVKRDDRYKLILVCRPEEWAVFDHPYKQEKWLEVHHTSGEGLLELYNRALVALVALVAHTKNPYNKYSIPVKTFEYMSYGLPIVSVNNQALSRFIESEGVGVVVEPNASSFADGIQKITASQKQYSEYAGKVRKALLTRNLWSHRVDAVMKDLLSVEEGNAG